jgi:hypothetical protein
MPARVKIPLKPFHIKGLTMVYAYPAAPESTLTLATITPDQHKNVIEKA